jgi:hypothetical protein
LLETLLKNGFAYHATESERLARELEAAAETARGEPACWPQFLRIATHTVGEHLGDWPRAGRLGDAVLAGQTPTVETGKAWAYLSIARRMAGDPAGAAEAQRAWVASAGSAAPAAALELRFMHVSALVGSGRAAEAMPLYLAALGEARALGAAAPRGAICAVSSTLATELLEARSRTPDEAALMRLAAVVSHELSLVGGGWYDEVCGHYLKALVDNVDGKPEAALGHVAAARAVIAANEPCPVDEAFLRLATAHARHLLGEAQASAEALAASDAMANTWDKPGLIAWHAEERARVFPDLPPREMAPAP